MEVALPCIHWGNPQILLRKSTRKTSTMGNFFSMGAGLQKKKGLHKVLGTPLGKYLITEIVYN